MVAIGGEHRIIERDERRGISFVLALAVHGLLVLFLVISVKWKTQPVAQGMDVELWGAPPPAPVAVEVLQPEPRVEPKVEEPKPEPVPEKKPEIVEKMEKPVKPKPQKASPPKVEPKKLEPLEQKKPAEPKSEPKPEKKAEKKPDATKAEPSLADLLNQGMNERNKAPAMPGGKAGGTGTNPKALTNTGAGGGSGTGAGGGGGLGDKYLGQVVSLIKSNLVYAGSKPEGAKAKIKVFLLPDGTVRDAQLLKAVGDPAYAEAARRAVITTAKFPPRPGGKLFSGGDREWTLSFCAKETAVCTVD